MQIASCHCCLLPLSLCHRSCPFDVFLLQRVCVLLLPFQKVLGIVLPLQLRRQRQARSPEVVGVVWHPTWWRLLYLHEFIREEEERVSPPVRATVVLAPQLNVVIPCPCKSATSLYQASHIRKEQYRDYYLGRRNVVLLPWPNLPSLPSPLFHHHCYVNNKIKET